MLTAGHGHASRAGTPRAPARLFSSPSTEVECRAGELLKVLPRAQGKDGHGLRLTLSQSQIPEPTAKRWQTMAPLKDRVRELEAA